MRAELEMRKCPYRILTGDWQERQQQAESIVCNLFPAIEKRDRHLIAPW